MSKQLRICYFLEEICATKHHEKCAEIFENKEIGIRAICNCDCHKEKSSGSELTNQTTLEDFRSESTNEYYNS